MYNVLSENHYLLTSDVSQVVIEYIITFVVDNILDWENNEKIYMINIAAQSTGNWVLQNFTREKNVYRVIHIIWCTHFENETQDKVYGEN